ncbi:MAG: Rv2993c-like domain-containing protein, partial [Methanothermobacter thermautotrophicus]
MIELKFLRFMKDGRLLHGFTENRRILEIREEEYLSDNPEVIAEHSLDDVRILPPVSPSKVVCVG